MASLLLPIIYLGFISLGLPDSLLGSAWPTMYCDFGVPVSYAGIISMIIAGGTVASSLLSDRLTLKLGTGKITAISVALTATALTGFSFSHHFILLCLIAVPYGLGAGSIDAALNNYVALNYKSRHMSWLHCMWGAGASIGPSIMGRAISAGHGWNAGYRYISVIQVVLTVILVLSLPLWKKNDTTDSGEKRKPVPFKEIMSICGSKEIMTAFFCYCAIEQTTGLWAASYLVLNKGVSSEIAAFFASMFFIGITAGRAINGFLTFKFKDIQMIRFGMAVILCGIAALTAPLGQTQNGQILALTGFVLVGLGCAPIYPCVIHSTPSHFGKERSQAIIGVQMASAYVGTCLMPPLFGLISNHITIALLPLYLAVCLVMMFIMNERLEKISTKI